MRSVDDRVCRRGLSPAYADSYLLCAAAVYAFPSATMNATHSNKLMRDHISTLKHAIVMMRVH